MLAKEVEQLLARQAELASNLAQVRREKELLEGENDMLYAEAESGKPSAAPTRTVAERGTSPAFASPRGSPRAAAVTSAETSSPVTESSPSSLLVQHVGESAAAAAAVPPPHPPPPSSSSAAVPRLSWKSVQRKLSGTPAGMPLPKADGPDAELAAKLIGRLNRAGESYEAQTLSRQVDALLGQQEEMKEAMERFQREKAEMEAEMGRLKEIENIASPAVSRQESLDASSTSASEARIAARESELAMKLRDLEQTVAMRVKVAVEKAAAERQDAEVAAARQAAVDREEAGRRVATAERRLASAEQRAADAEKRAAAAAAQAAEATSKNASSSSSSSPSGDAGGGIPEHIWNRMLADKETEIGVLRAGAAAKDKEIDTLAARVRELEEAGVVCGADDVRLSPGKAIRLASVGGLAG